MIRLDDAAAMATLDAGRMLHYLHELPEVAAAAFERGAACRLPLDRPEAILICGMGGSAISGDLIRTQLLPLAPVPVIVHRGDTLPAFAGPKTLAIFMSYSGNTHETTSCLKAALDRGVPTVAVSSGGTVEALASQHGFPVVSVPGGWMPRAALGDLFFALLGLVSRLVPEAGAPAVDTIERLRALRDRLSEGVATEANPAKQLALALLGKTPIVFGATPTTEAVALRWKCQINENSKQTALFGVWPELTHNDIVNLTAGDHAEHVIVALTDPADSEFVSKQRSISLEQMKPYVGGVHELAGEGESLMARQLTSIYFGDYVSVYLAFLRGVDPTPVDTIFALKDRMKSAMNEATNEVIQA